MMMEFATFYHPITPTELFSKRNKKNRYLLNLVANITVSSQYLSTWVFHIHARAFPRVITAFLPSNLVDSIFTLFLFLDALHEVSLPLFLPLLMLVRPSGFLGVSSSLATYDVYPYLIRPLISPDVMGFVVPS